MPSPGTDANRWENSEPIRLFDFGDLYNCKDYRFFQAITGWNYAGPEPVTSPHPPRGCPATVGDNTRQAIERDNDLRDIGGWLLLSEIEDCLRHANLTHDMLAFSFQAVLALMAWLAQKCGAENVRLIFTIE